MSKQYQSGDKILFLYKDGKWYRGVIHGVRTVEDHNGIVKSVSYLVDTGRNTRVDEYPFNHRDREISKRLNENLPKGADHDQANKMIKDIMASPDLPEDKMDVEKVRQPEQIELSAEQIKPYE